ncbi:MAG: thiosulfate oxidation carrier complex protein SoxZ, partial [Loktanella sp.]|nr:thiosulfate oxidation carrier complex protein SoxZ [Loktanella sp.]
LPDTAEPGEVIQIRTLIDHPMITAVSSDLPRDMLDHFTVTMNGDTLISYDFDNGSAENPTFTFYAKVTETSDFVFVWTHEDGTEFTLERQVTVG